MDRSEEDGAPPRPRKGPAKTGRTWTRKTPGPPPAGPGRGPGREEGEQGFSGERLNRYVAHAAGVSRREADRLVQDGRVTVNGRVEREPGTRVDPAKDAVKLNGKRVAGRPAAVYYLLNKPRGMVCSMEDPQERPCVGDLLKKVKGRPVPAGRLDFDTEGLLLCTNDGDTVQRIIHPRHRVRKVYHVKVSGLPAEREMEKLRSGILLDGTYTLPAGVYVIKRGVRNCWIRMTLLEGRNRQVRRMMEAVGVRVLKLRRVALGPLKIGGLKPGEYRTLDQEEVGILLRFLEDLDKEKVPAYHKIVNRKKGSTRGRAVR